MTTAAQQEPTPSSSHAESASSPQKGKSWIKKIVILVAFLLVVVIGVLAWAAMNANKLIAEYKPTLEKVASDALGASVTLGKLETTIFPNTKVVVDEFKVARSKEAQEGVTFSNLALHLKLLPLLSGDLRISKLSLDSPSITFIKGEDGVYIEGLPNPKKGAKRSAGPVASGNRKSKSGDKNRDAQAGPLPSAIGVNLDAFQLTNAALHFKDLKSGKTYSASDIDLHTSLSVEENMAKLSGLEITGSALGKAPFSVDSSMITYHLGNGRMASDKIDLSIAGNRLGISTEVDSKALSGKFSVDSGGMELSNFAPFLAEIPALAKLSPSGKVAPKLNGTFALPKTFAAKGTIGLDDIGLKPANLVVRGLKGNIQLDGDQDGQNITSEDLTLVVGDQPMKVQLAAVASPKQIEMSSLQVSAFSGTISGTGTLELGGDKPFRSNLSVSKLELGQALSSLKPGATKIVVGSIDSFKSSVRGTFNENMMSSLSGTASLALRDGELRGVNLAGKVLRAVKSLPFLSGALYGAVPESQRGLVDSEHTGIKSLTSDFQLGGGKIRTKNLKMSSILFDMRARGSIGFDMKTDLDSTFLFNQRFSESLALAVKELRRIFDDQGRLVIPLEISGTLPKVTVLPDLTELLKQGAMNTFKEKTEGLIQEGIGKLFGGF